VKTIKFEPLLLIFLSCYFFVHTVIKCVTSCQNSGDNNQVIKWKWKKLMYGIFRTKRRAINLEVQCFETIFNVVRIYLKQGAKVCQWDMISVYIPICLQVFYYKIF